jgi:adenosylhomocysteine nucleosidase
MEFPGFLSHAADPRPAKVAADWARTAHLGSHDVLLVANGAGARRAAAAVDAALAVFKADAVVSTGFCGALDPGLAIAGVVVASSIVSGVCRYPAMQPTCPAPHHIGVVCSIDHVARTASEKAGLRAAGSAAVEMEAAGVAEQAATRGLPFYCVRAVTDLAGEDMANNFNEALRPDGHFATMLILRGAVRHPWVRLPELIRLRQRSVRAARVLGDFIADCRF